MRWLRCLLSREFKIENTLMFWDFIWGGIEAKHRIDMKNKDVELLSIDDDPLANLDYICVAMIMNIKTELLESDFSMCFALLLNYPEPNVPEVLLRNAIKIKNKMKEAP
jgi:TBC1 domain family protein 5